MAVIAFIMEIGQCFKKVNRTLESTDVWGLTVPPSFEYDSSAKVKSHECYMRKMFLSQNVNYPHFKTMPAA